MKFNEVTIAEADDDIRLDRWFKRHAQGVPHAMLQKWLRKGDVRLDGKKAETSTRVKAGQTLRAPVVEEGLSPQPKVKLPISPVLEKTLKNAVLYQDANLLILNKPAGLAVQGGTGQRESVDDSLDIFREKNGDRPKLVHRLDKDTSGVLVLAKNAKAATALTKAFSAKTIKKSYWALVVGNPKIPQGCIDLALAKQVFGESSHMRAVEEYEVVQVDEEEGKRAVTLYRVIERIAKKFAWLEMVPITGRTHQLRVHAAHMGTPILGDGKYGALLAHPEGMVNTSQLHLHAHTIRIPAELFGKAVEVSAPLPPHMKNTWDDLGLDAKVSGLSLLDQEE